MRGAGPPPFRPVQLAQLVDSVPAGNRWLHEMKYDGYRTLIAVGGGDGRAYTRSGLWRATPAGEAFTMLTWRPAGMSRPIIIADHPLAPRLLDRLARWAGAGP